MDLCECMGGGHWEGLGYLRGKDAGECVFLAGQKSCSWAGEMAQGLRTERPGSISSTYMVVPSCLEHQFGYPTSSSSLFGYQTPEWYTYIYVGKTLIYVKKKNYFKNCIYLWDTMQFFGKCPCYNYHPKFSTTYLSMNHSKLF